MTSFNRDILTSKVLIHDEVHRITMAERRKNKKELVS